MSKIASLFAAIAVVCLFALPSFAFVPNDDELMAKVRKIYGPLSSWEAVMTFPEHPDVSVHLWYARGKWRQEWKAGETARAIGVNGRVAGKCTSGDFPLSPMFVWMPANPVEAWRSWGADNATRVYGFCDDMPCMILGSEPGDDVLPTVHVNNEDMAPLLVRYPTGQTMTTIRYIDYRTYGGFRVPGKMVLTVGDESLEGVLDWRGVNRAGSQELYSRDGLDTTPCAAPPSPFDFLRDNFRYPEVRPVTESE